MKLSASIELVMQFATYEAIAGKFREVEPEHLLMALLKFPELPIAEMEKLAPGVSSRQIAKEIEAVSKELQEMQIDSKSTRRQLRTKLGRGNSPFSGGRIHRSSASRDIFNLAAKFADDTRSEVITAECILKALISSPTPRIEQILGDVIKQHGEIKKNTPNIDEYAKDLVELALNGNLKSASDRVTEGKALVSVLSQNNCKNVLLITDDERSAKNTVENAAAIITHKEECPENLKNTKVLDVTNFPSPWNWQQDDWDRMKSLLAEAGNLENVILFLPPLQQTKNESTENKWLNFLETTLDKVKVPCIFHVEPVIYEHSIKNNPVWKRLVETIQINENKNDAIPWEL